MLLAGVFVFVVAYVGFLWLQFNGERHDSRGPAETSSEHQEPVPEEQTLVMPDPAGAEQQALSSEKPRQPVKALRPLTEKSSNSREQVDARYPPANEIPRQPENTPLPLTQPM